MFTINYRDPRPIYEQITDSVKKLILSGVLAGDDRLPSVREAAAKLAINPNTIQRAYRELEQSGYIYCVAGKGNFVCPPDETIAVRKNQLLSRLSETAAELRSMGLGDEDLIAIITRKEEKADD
ncbi:MAG: GntR family transcriptional regulator [Oscillospiraceae bacterium]|nr:GntR family transcriptional regulator [Oscillospiraceae bacterium]